MPQDIPYERSETLAFTPDCLKTLGDGAPVFTLRAATTREKRFRMRLLHEAGITTHSPAEIRAETLKGLEALWGSETFAQQRDAIETYWSAVDDFASIQKKDPDAVWEYDPEIESALTALLSKTAKSWPALGVMNADNAEYQAVFPDATIAVIAKAWTNLPVPVALDRGYLDFECVDALRTRLATLEDKAGAARGRAFLELWLACVDRIDLDEEEAKNSASPSPSSGNQEPSTETNVSAPAGKSRASASSKKTPETA